MKLRSSVGKVGIKHGFNGFEAVRLAILGNPLYIFAQVAEKLRIFHFSIDKPEKIMYNSNGYIFINIYQTIF